MKQKIIEIIKKIRRRVLVWRVNRALGIELYDWQIAKIFDDKPFPETVQRDRRAGKTTAQILFILLNKKFADKTPCLFVDEIANTLRLGMLPDQYAAAVAYTFGEDGVVRRRRDFFVREVIKVKKELQKRRIRTNGVSIRSRGRIINYL